MLVVGATEILRAVVVRSQIVVIFHVYVAKRNLSSSSWSATGNSWKTNSVAAPIRRGSKTSAYSFEWYQKKKNENEENTSSKSICSVIERWGRELALTTITLIKTSTRTIISYIHTVLSVTTTTTAIANNSVATTDITSVDKLVPNISSISSSSAYSKSGYVTVSFQGLTNYRLQGPQRYQAQEYQYQPAKQLQHQRKLEVSLILSAALESQPG